MAQPVLLLFFVGKGFIFNEDYSFNVNKICELTKNRVVYFFSEESALTTNAFNNADLN